ncbi:MAG: hypothetical protein WD688_04165 [Candidatus Binatia bacterium]
MKHARMERDKKRGKGRVRTEGEKARGATVKVKPKKDEQSCRTKNPKPLRGAD